MHAFTYIFLSFRYKFLNIFKLKRITWTLLLSNKKYRLPFSLEENEHLFRHRALLEGNLFRREGAPGADLEGVDWVASHPPTPFFGEAKKKKQNKLKKTVRIF